MKTRSGRTYHPRITGGARSGAVGSITLGLEWPDNSVAVAAVTTGIIEQSSGAYTGSRVAPVVTEETEYIIVWYDPVIDESVTESLIVEVSSVTSEGLLYASPDDLRRHLDVTEDQMPDAVLVRPIRLAQRDLDAACGSWITYGDTGLKFATNEVEDLLTDIQVRHLVQAMCYQVEYRLTMGEDFMIKEQYEGQSGPGYSTQGTLKKVMGMAYEELRKAGLLRLYGKATNRGTTRFGELPRAN